MSEDKVKRLAPPMEVVLLDEIAGRLGDLFDLTRELVDTTKAEHPQGLMDQKIFTVTDRITTYKTTHKWMSVYFFNYGPNTVYIQTNDKGIPFIEILNEEDLDVDFKTAIIERVYLYCDVGETARVKVIGKW